MTGNVLLAVEAMTLGVKRMADYAKTLGYQLELLADDPGMYMDRDDTPTTEFPTKDSQALEEYIQNRRSEIAGIFSSTDTWGLAAAQLREKFDFPSRITSDKLSKMRDKAWVQKQITDNQDHDPATFPQIAKPRGGTGSWMFISWQIQNPGISFCKRQTIQIPIYTNPFIMVPFILLKFGVMGINLSFLVSLTGP